MQMIHLGLTSIYTVAMMYYLFTPVSTLEQRLHATCIAFLMMYSLIRTFVKIDDLPVFFLMHWALYVIDGGRGIPFWMVVHVFTLCTSDLLHTAEEKIYTMVSEMHRLHPYWQFEFMYTHDMPRLSLTSADQREDNDLLHSFVETRRKHETPVISTVEEKTIWRLSDNKSILLDREHRNFITLSLQTMTFCMYMLWWSRLVGGFRYYFFFDFTLYWMLMSGWRVRLLAYHGLFAIATFYLQFTLFNSSLKTNNVVVH